MNNTKIEWCDSTWNPVTGCLHGCEYCYARNQAKRFEGYGGADGKIITYNPLKISELYIPLTITRKNGKTVTAPYPFGFEPTFHRYLLDIPQHWKKPRTIFVCSMADLFGDWVPDEWIEEVFKACEKATQHRYLFLTKNPKRYGDLAKAGKLPQRENMWYGSTLDNMRAKRYPGRLLDNTFVTLISNHSIDKIHLLPVILLMVSLDREQMVLQSRHSIKFCVKSKSDQTRCGLQSKHGFGFSLNCHAPAGGDGMRTAGVNTVSARGKNIKRGNPITRILCPQTLSKAGRKPYPNSDKLLSNVT